jgi:predicted oxidoreductase
MQQESPHFLVDDTLAGLAAKMNALTASHHIDPATLQATADAFDANFARGNKLHNDDQIRRILHARQWGPDRLRTCAPAPLQKPGAGPFIAIHMQLITRKSLGGLQTDLQSRVLNGGWPAHCRALRRGRGGRVWRRWSQRQTLAGRHVFARLHPHGAGGGTRHRQRRR